ncbi:MAG: GNAT family N-acetyltransferase [Novosphingobium sp.]|nr:GNAT family N-acetyltransferase [Novosphingobium sp.]
MPEPVTARVAGAVSDLPAAQWDALSGGGNPFMRHAFLAALEQSGSVGGRSGWTPAPLTIADADGRLVAALPAYLKQHSQGEYVFDHAWADAWSRAGGRYYPKLQIAAPFTPATGPRLLTRDPALGLALLRAAEKLCELHQLSSAHATFVEPMEVPLFEAAGWLIRSDIQFHWRNRGYADFEDFLAQLSSRKRKAIRKERAAAQAGVRIEALSGEAIRPEHWDAFWEFYQDTGSRKWGRPYLTRAAFDRFGATMGDDIVLVLAFVEATPIAGALNFLGRETLYGRYWGACVDKPFLHFELCYYQAIEIAIARGLAGVEAGAQGPHKLSRGYEPVRTFSAHWVADPGFRAAVADFLERERAGVDAEQAFLGERAPFRKN